jgi:hypothetical protein
LFEKMLANNQTGHIVIRMSKTQYRVTFTCLDTINGNVVRVSGGTRWFDSRESAENSTWAGAGMNIRCLSMDDAKIITRNLEQ